MPALTSHETTLMVSVLEVKLKLPVSQGSVGVSNNQSTPWELWKHLGHLESTQTSRVCSLLSRVLKLRFHFYCALPTSPCIHFFNHKSFLNYRKLRQIISYFIKYCISLSSAGSWESSSFNVT